MSHAIPEGVNITNLEVRKGTEPDPFEGCTNLLDITVDANCEGYYVQDRALYRTGGTELHEVADAEKEEEIRALGELIDLAEALIAEVTTSVDPTGKTTEVALNATQGNDYYIWCNNPHTSGNDGAGGVAALLDEDAGSYLHSNWSSLSSTHDYLQIDFGNAVGLDNFKIAGQQRNSGSNDRPKNIEIYGSNDGTNWTPITTVEGLPNTSGATWESGAISAAERYSHLKFIVKTHDNYNQTSSVSRPYFHMAKFDLLKLTSTAEVANVYKNLAGVTADEVENVYDNLAEALYYYNNGGTAEQLTAAYNVLKPLYDALNAKKDNVFNGVYNIKYKGEPIFVAYTNAAVESMSNDVAGYKLFDVTLDGTDAKHQELQNNAIAAKVAADALFTIVPNSELTGYTLSAQGLYLHSTRNGGWAPQLLSADEAQAGVYLFEETETDIYKIKSNRNDIQYINDWGPVFGNDKSNKPNLSTFTLEQITEYTLNVPANGATTLCLPFNVQLPAGVTAYDLAKANITTANRYSTYELVEVAGEGDVLAKNTPVIIKANANDYTLTITMNGEGAKGSVENSLLRSGIVKTTLGEGNNYTFDGVDFNLVAAGTVIPANQCWMELDENLGGIIYAEAPVVVLTTDEENPVLYKIQINRNFDAPNASVLEYNANTGGVNVRADAADNSWQAWYFMAGNDGAVLIKPYNGDGKVLGADDNEDGHSKVWAVAKDSKTIDEWTIEQNGEWYNILGDGKCFSNHSGVTYKTMGFYDDKNDNGSQFKFVEAVFTDDNARYYQLKDVKATMEAIYCGESVGLYSTESVTAYREKLAEAQTLIDATSATSASSDCHVAYKALRAADEALVYNAPDANKTYYIVSTASGNGREYCAGEYVHTYRTPTGRSCWAGTNTYDQAHLLFDAKTDIEQLSLAAFQFEETGTMGEYKMKNLHTGMYVKAFAGTHMGAEGDPAVVKIAGVADGQVTLKIGNNAPMHAQNDFGVIVQWDCEGGNANSPSSWTINEVPQEDLNKIYTLAVPESGVTTLNLAFNVQLPEGVAAYDFVEGDIEQAEGSDRYEFNLTEVATAGEVLAKNTPVIIKANAGNYNLKVAFSDDNVKNGTAGSVLHGNYWQTTVGTAEANYLPGVDGRNFLFNYVATDNTPVYANTVWMTLAEKSGDIIYDNAEPAPEFTLPEVGKTYRIKSYVSKVVAEYQNHYIVNSTTGLTFSTAAANDNTDLWVCTGANEGNFTFASALGTAALGWKAATEDAVEFTITGGYENGAVTLKNNGKNLALMIDNAGNATFSEADNKTQSSGWSTDWYLEEVENAAVSFTTSIASGNLWATMYLPYAVEIPQGVEVYVASGIDNEKKVVNLIPVETNIPKNTAVLLHRSDDSVTTTLNLAFDLADEDVAAVGSNLFQGKIKRTAIPAADARVYLLVKYNGNEKFYWMKDEYDENCSLVPGGGTGGYVKCDANKCYLRIEENASPASSFSFRFEGSTSIDEVEGESGEVKAIYDLQGRKITEITKPGFYIVDGEKVLVK
ncbi:MAG: discoidin domain-containing protein [Bacteroidaceae bacterium]|nr:discoidin domain-containing protein [Bacteroidaceae bacterium]